MAKFRDANGREWPVVIPSVGAVARLRAEHDFDLNKAVQTWGGLLELLEDAERMLKAIWSLIPSPGISYEEWIEAINAEALERIRHTFAEAVLDFFHYGRAEAMKEKLRSHLSLTANTSRSASSELPGDSPASAGSVQKA